METCEVDKSDKEGKEPKATSLQEQASADSGVVVADLIGQEEALHLKTLAEQKYATKNIQSALKHAKRAHKLKPSLEGLSEMITALKILYAAETPIFPATTESSSVLPPDYYRILQLERFSHINAIKKQYKKLALTLHPDKNPLPACEEAFKFVGEAVRVLSDKIRRKEYDMRLRIVMQSQTEGVAGVGAETFWTACSTCRLLHKFERKYLGHSLMCPRCKKCFKAVEVKENAGIGQNVEDMEVNEGDGAGPTRISARIQERVLKGKKVGVLEKFDFGMKRKISIAGKPLERLGEKVARYEGQDGGVKSLRLKRVEEVGNPGENGDVAGLNKVGKSASGYGRSSADSASGMPKRAKVHGEETMTLAQMQMLIKQKKADVDKLWMKTKKDNYEKLQHKEAGDRKKMNTTKGNKEMLKRKENEETKEKKMLNMNVNCDTHSASKDGNMEVMKKSASEYHSDMEIEVVRASKKGDLVIMPVEDSEFHDFDNARKARSFKKGQVWAAYDDDDGMPRHYALIDDVSVNPFAVSLSWLEFEYKGDEDLMLRQKMGCISCGRFKVSRKIMVKYRNLFSHIVDNERAARDLYRIYPKKNSIWALYQTDDSNTERSNAGVVKDKRCYNIIVSLSSYSDIHGLSIAFLEKVDGFRTVFKRREVGARAVQWLGKDDIKLFSHQIPAEKLSGDEAVNLPKDCWELDPASLSSWLFIG